VTSERDPFTDIRLSIDNLHRDLAGVVRPMRAEDIERQVYNDRDLVEAELESEIAAEPMVSRARYVEALKDAVGSHNQVLDLSVELDKAQKQHKADIAQIVEALGFTGPMSIDEICLMAEQEVSRSKFRSQVIRMMCDAIGQPELALDMDGLIQRVKADRQLLNDVRHFLGLAKDAGWNAVLVAIQDRSVEPLVADLPEDWEWATMPLGGWYAKGPQSSLWVDGDQRLAGDPRRAPLPVVKAVLARHAGAPWVSRTGTVAAEAPTDQAANLGVQDHRGRHGGRDGWGGDSAQSRAERFDPPEPQPTIKVDDTVEIASRPAGGADGPPPGVHCRVASVEQAFGVSVEWMGRRWFKYRSEVRKVEPAEEPVLSLDPPMDPSGWAMSDAEAEALGVGTITGTIGPMVETVRLHSLNWRMSLDGDGILLEQTEGGGLVLADSFDSTADVISPPEPRYPLWCIEVTTPVRDPEISYIAGFETLIEAETDAADLLRDGNGVRLRRCRRLAVSERTDVRHLVEHILGVVLDEHDVEPRDGAVITNPYDPESPRVRLSNDPKRERELAEWLDRWLETDAWICKGDEK
jgi:hypothetical protein